MSSFDQFLSSTTISFLFSSSC